MSPVTTSDRLQLYSEIWNHKACSKDVRLSWTPENRKHTYIVCNKILFIYLFIYLIYRKMLLTLPHQAFK